MRKGFLLGIAAALLIAGTATASGYIITSINQIKPTVRAKLRSDAAVKVRVSVGPYAFLGPGDSGAASIGSSIAHCPPGTIPISGGYDSGKTPSTSLNIAYNEPVKGGWGIVAGNNSTASATIAAVAVCAGGSPSPQMRAATATEPLQAAVRALRHQ